MDDIKLISIEDINHKTIININYPYINSSSKLIDKINEDMYRDVMIFREISEEEIEELNQKKYLSYINTEYKVCKNSNEILSIYIIFSQLLGLSNMEYINSYNYDIREQRKITLSDIFQNKIYLKIFNIDENQEFCIEDDGIVICYSSYEYSETIEEVTMKKIYFKDISSYLTPYIIGRLDL